ncbi:MAG: outer membrane beta-barrel protein [Bacteroidota bacterium]
MLRLFLALCLCLLFLGAASQNASLTLSGRMTLNDEQDTPANFGQLSLLNAQDSSIIQGALTDQFGAFSMVVAPGNYILRYAATGYEPYFTEAFELQEDREVPSVRLKAKSITLSEVQITGEKDLVELDLDKKVYNVSKDLSNQGATASEILGNLPSVTVNQNGQVSLRGSGDVRILIDGKPSGLIGPDGEGLAQLQGNLIESVEIITNPSARYEAEGTGGVINIVLKKDRRQGFNGSIDLTAGYPTNVNAAVNLNYRVKKVNFFINYGFGYRINPYRGTVYQEVYRGDSTFISLQESSGQFQGLVNNIRGGLDYYFDENNILTAAYRFRRTDGQRFSYFRYEDYLNSTNNPTAITEREQEEVESEPYSEYALTYKRKFQREGQELTMDARYLNYWENSDQIYPETSWLPGQSREQGTTFVQRAVNDEFENQYLFQLDYVQPFGKDGTLEGGVRLSFRDMTNDYLATEEQADGEWIALPGFDNVFQYNENIQAVYGILGNKQERISYQVGLRAEATSIATELVDTNETNERDFQNLFPSGLFALHLPAQNDLQISYSRRIRRPTYRELSPFITLSDRRNFFSGNRDLNPEFSHSVELSHLKYFEQGVLTSALYFRNSSATIQSIRLVDENGLASTLPYNLVGQNAFGADIAFSYALTPWWKLDANFNAFRAITDATNLDANFSSDTYSWFVRQTSKFKLPKETSLQLRTNYQAPELIPQGRREAIFTLDVAIKKELWQRKGAITLSGTNLLNTNRSIVITEGEGFFTDRFSLRQPRQINLTLTYRIKQ